MRLEIDALTNQWTAFVMNDKLIGKVRDPMIGAMQPATVAALRNAQTFAWTSDTTRAVAAASERMPVDFALSAEALGDYAQSLTSGWWWFEEPIEIQTTERLAKEEPVCALLWRREVHPKHGPRVWFQTMILQNVPVSTGRRQGVPFPTTGWVWPDGESIRELPDAFTRGYVGMFDTGARKPGYEMAGLEATVSASVWFSRFFLSALTWLKQRVAVAEPAGCVRQVARSIQREHNLKERPLVRVVHLRRRESRAATSDVSRPVDWSCRWIVHGFWRQQFYPKTQTHAPIWINDFVKGPNDKPLRTGPRVFAVDR